MLKSALFSVGGLCGCQGGEGEVPGPGRGARSKSVVRKLDEGKVTQLGGVALGCREGNEQRIRTKKGNGYAGNRKGLEQGRNK